MLHSVLSSPSAGLSFLSSLPTFHLNDRIHGLCPHRAIACFATAIEGRSLSPLQHALHQRHLFFIHCKTGALDAAIALFPHISHSHILVWNAFIQAHLRKGLHQRTLHIFEQILQEGIMPNKVTFACILSACSVLQWLSEGRQVHARVQLSKLSSNLIVNTALLDMYGKCGSLKAASQTMETLSERDAVAFNAMLTSLFKHRCSNETLQLFEQMQQEGVMPNRVTYITIAEVCAMHHMLTKGERICACTFASKEYRADLPLGNAFIHMYGKCNHPKKAEEHFAHMSTWDTVSWNTLLGVYDYRRSIEDILILFNLMQEKGFLANECTYITLLSSCVSHMAVFEGMCIHFCIVNEGLGLNIALSTALLSMYGRCGSVEDAERVFNKIDSKNVVSWNAIIGVCMQHNNNEDAVHLFHRMMGVGMQPDKVTFANVLAACANAALLVEGKSISLLACKSELQRDPIIGTSIVNMYGKCGELEEARMAFFRICSPTIFSWNAMLTMYAYHGEGESVFGLFNQMQKEGIVADDVTCLAFLLGCEHLGLVSEGICFFTSIRNVYGLVPSRAHYVSMIDLLGKAGQLGEAACLIDMMPFSSDEVSISALASAYDRYCIAEPRYFPA